MSVYASQLTRVAEAINIASPDCAWWYGRPISSATKIVTPDQLPARELPGLKDGLQSHLYHSFYCTGGATPWPPGSAPGHESGGFRVLLAGSHSARGSWSTGWDVWEPAGHGMVGVSRDELQCWASPSDVAEHEKGIALGDTVRVRVPAERLRTFPGFYGILGYKDLASREVARFYWNIERDGASILLRELSASLDAAEVGYRLKVVSDPGAYCRCDAGVLYIDQSDIGIAAGSIRHAYFLVRGQLKPQVPALTRRLGAGLGFAESPSANMSFGFQRCGVIADALVQSHLGNITSVAGRINFIIEHFERAGISPDQPYLNSGWSDHAISSWGDLVA